MVIDQLSAVKSRAGWCCEHQIATSVLADVCLRLPLHALVASLPGRHSGRSITTPWWRGSDPCVRESVHAVLQKYVNRLGLEHGYSPHPMRATCITTALENGVKLDDRQRAVGHADPTTTQPYDRRRFLPAKSAALMVEY